MNNKQNTYRQICEVNLHAKHADLYGESYREHFLEQYKIAIQGIDYTSKWKHIVNNYFLGINTVLLAAIGLSASRIDVAMPVLTHQIVPVIGMFIAIAWWLTVKNYNDVLAAKFAILHCIEEHLPLALYVTEWELLKASHGNPHSAKLVEASVPAVFFMLYVLVVIAG